MEMRGGATHGAGKRQRANRNDETIVYLSREALVELVGFEGAARIVEQFGGTRLWIPRIESDGHQSMVRRLGYQIAYALAAEYGGEQVDLPARRRSDQIVDLHQQGLPVAEIVRRTGYTRRHVHRVLRLTGDKCHPVTASHAGG